MQNVEILVFISIHAGLKFERSSGVPLESQLPLAPRFRGLLFAQDLRGHYASTKLLQFGRVRITRTRVVQVPVMRSRCEAVDIEFSTKRLVRSAVRLLHGRHSACPSTATELTDLFGSRRLPATEPLQISELVSRHL
jgi:hypothetical protein